jgi:hypothetical protein
VRILMWFLSWPRTFQQVPPNFERERRPVRDRLVRPFSRATTRAGILHMLHMYMNLGVQPPPRPPASFWGSAAPHPQTPRIWGDRRPPNRGVWGAGAPQNKAGFWMAAGVQGSCQCARFLVLTTPWSRIHTRQKASAVEMDVVNFSTGAICARAGRRSAPSSLAGTTRGTRYRWRRGSAKTRRVPLRSRPVGGRPCRRATSTNSFIFIGFGGGCQSIGSPFDRAR